MLTGIHKLFRIFNVTETTAFKCYYTLKKNKQIVQTDTPSNMFLLPK